MHLNANANAVRQLTTELWPAVPNPMIQCAHNIGLANTAHMQKFTNTAHMHKFVNTAHE